jgi:hypothetical protein
MTDATTATAIHRYVQLWNEHDPARRRAAFGELLNADSLYTDPDWEAVIGPDAINTMIGRAQEKLGELRFSVTAIINSHHDLALFTWHLGLPDGTPPVATGYDVIGFDDGGRIGRVYGFFV